MNILFVCTGNTCRSPMAEALLKSKNGHKVQSAGIFANEGAPINDHARDVLQQRDIESNHHAQRVTESLMEWADLVLTMTNSHQQLLWESYPLFQQKIHPLKSYISSESNSKSVLNKPGDIIDPFGQGLASYKETLSELDIYLERLMQKIEAADNDNGTNTSL